MIARALRPSLRAVLGACALALSALVLSEPVLAQDCRIAFDLGSSGIRAGSSLAVSPAKPTRRNLDLLTPLWAGQGLRSQMPAVTAALLELPAQAGWPARCARIGAGFSAWRLAWQQEAAALPDLLGSLRASTGVAVFILPPVSEGQLAYRSAREVLGPALVTSHVLDIGGGSMQVAGESSTFGTDLGQKAWLQKLCAQLSPGSRPACTLQALSVGALAQARSLALEQLKDLPAELGPGVSMTAITRPVTRGVLPALRALGQRREGSIELGPLTAAIDTLAKLELGALARMTGTAPAFAGYLLSDMLLLEALLKVTQAREVKVAEAEINNLPALLADERSYTWGQHYACYLQRLAQQGLAAYLSDPASCPPP